MNLNPDNSSSTSDGGIPADTAPKPPLMQPPAATTPTTPVLTPPSSAPRPLTPPIAAVPKLTPAPVLAPASAESAPVAKPAIKLSAPASSTPVTPPLRSPGAPVVAKHSDSPKFVSPMPALEESDDAVPSFMPIIAGFAAAVSVAFAVLIFLKS